MTKIKNITELRDHALDTLEKLAQQKIDIAEAGVTGKLCEGVISTIKAQLEYSRMLGEEPKIPFMSGSTTGKPLAIQGRTINPRLDLDK